MTAEGNATWIYITAESKILQRVMERGSIAIDGISLTVAQVSQDSFAVSVIPHTADKTTLLDKRTGDRVNLENDLVGKYVQNFLKVAGVLPGEEEQKKKDGLTLDMLEAYLG
jgi:riboflavin synthase